MKKFLSVILAVIMVFAVSVTAFAAEGENTYSTTSSLSFNNDGKFKIMQVNDIQDDDFFSAKTKTFLEKALDSEKPDLVVIVGDNLSDVFIGATKSRITKAIKTVASIFNDAKVPFAVTFGNHDHDLENKMSIADMKAIFNSFEYCVNIEGNDPGTYNIPIMSSDESKVALNVYMMDTHNKTEDGSSYSGVHADQIEWYKNTGNALKEANGGKAVPSMVFQHIPVKEIYQFVEQGTAKDKDAFLSLDDFKWYKFNSDKIISEYAVMGEAPCSESQDVITGQYEAWLEQGDIIGAFFAHDHVNNFVGKTDEGIVMGYNGGTGFATYGNGANRSARIFEFDENSVEDYTTRSVTYSSLTGDTTAFYFIDLISPSIVGKILRPLLSLFA